jgi:hypothetical protein
MTKSVTRHSSPQNPILSNSSGGPICLQTSISTREHVTYASFDRLDKSSFHPLSPRPPRSSLMHTLTRCTCPLRVFFRYISQAQCSLTYYPEFRMLHSETAKTLGDCKGTTCFPCTTTFLSIVPYGSPTLCDHFQPRAISFNLTRSFLTGDIPSQTIADHCIRPHSLARHRPA